MRHLPLVIPVILVVAGCTTSESGFRGAGFTTNTSGGSASGTISQRGDGAYALALSIDGSACTAVYDSPVPGGSELSPLTCSRGQGGNATVVYDDDGRPASATFGGVEIGSGTITF